MTAATLLLVEDDMPLQDLLADGLTEAGFDVIAAGSGRQALGIFDACGTRFNGVITDVRLGEGPDGWDVGRRARAVSAGIPVIYISGDSGHCWAVEGVANSAFLAKPFRISQLLATVTALFGAVQPPTAGSHTHQTELST